MHTSLVSTFIAATLALAACSGADREGRTAQSGSPCPRPAAADATGSEIVLTDQRAPCRIQFAESGIVLRSDADGTRPDPGMSILRDRRGRIYSANASGFAGTISLWSPEGEYLRTIASPGEGPGELSTRGAVTIYLDAHDRLHVRDGGPNWSVFTAQQEFVRRVPARIMGGSRTTTAILDDGRAINGSFYSSVDNSYYFQIADSLGNLERSIAPIEIALDDRSQIYLTRAVVHGGGDTFWAGPAIFNNGFGPMGYRLEEWSLTGEKVRTIRREVPWFPISWPEPPSRPEGSPQPRPAMAINALHIDDEGVLLVFIAGPSDQWRSLTYREQSELSQEERVAMYTILVEAIDTRTGALLASDTLSSPEQMAPFENLTPRSRFGARHEVDENMLPVVHLLEYDLVVR